jgi:hypothetical protein
MLGRSQDVIFQPAQIVARFETGTGQRLAEILAGPQCLDTPIVA